MPRPVLADSPWGPRLFCCVTLCLLRAGLVDASVTQSPSHLIKAKGGKSILKCYPDSGHDSVSWYQQAPGQAPQFLVEYYEMSQRAKGSMPGRFAAQQFDDYHSELNLSALELGDTAVYLCASSLAQPCRITGFLYPNLPGPAEDRIGKGWECHLSPSPVDACRALLTLSLLCCAQPQGWWMFLFQACRVLLYLC
ncbi:T-cell receptor beta chain T17T-22 [Fukomys damarensis]|nr:T-cell receptor beta chain T17T-22 [Fukomys damarensis]